MATSSTGTVAPEKPASGPYKHMPTSTTNGPAPSASSTTLNSQDPRQADIKSWSQGFDRLADERLEKQRYVMSGKKVDEVSTLALGAKIDRALGRRMASQDAVFTRRESLSEKTGAVELEAAS